MDFSRRRFWILTARCPLTDTLIAALLNDDALTPASALGHAIRSRGTLYLCHHAAISRAFWVPDPARLADLEMLEDAGLRSKERLLSEALADLSGLNPELEDGKVIED
jgi:hypothetical protein